MSIFTESGKILRGLIPFILWVLIAASSLFAINRMLVKPAPLAITEGDVTFTAIVMGGDTKGGFESAEVEIQLDPATPQSGLLNVTVETASLQIGDRQIESTLMEPDWFAVAQYPQARFASSAMIGNRSGGIEISGTLTIKDISREITFDAIIEQTAEVQELKGGITINRLDYGIGANDQPDDSVVGFNVNIDFAIALPP